MVHSGRIVEEHLVPGDRSVSVGAHARCTILLPGEDQSERTELFVVRGGRVHLRLLPATRGKISIAGTVRTLDSLALDASTVRRGRDLLYPLADDARGKVSVRDYTLLFQLVEPPPQPAAARSDARWSWRDVDWIFLVLVAISALLHAAMMAWIEAQPPPSRVELRELVHHHVSLYLPPAPVADVPPEPATDDAAEASEEPSNDDADPAPASASSTPEPDSHGTVPAPGTEAPPSDPFAGTLLEVIGAAWNDPDGALVGLVTDPSDYRDIHEALASGEVRVAIERERPGLRGPSTVGDEAASIGELGPAGDCADCPPRPTSRPTHEAPKPLITVDPLPPAVPGVDFAIGPWLKRLHPRFRACYEKQLKLAPDLSGRVSMSFATDGAARVVDVTIEANGTGNAEFAGCIDKELRRFSFPAAAADLDVGPYTLLFTPQ